MTAVTSKVILRHEQLFRDEDSKLSALLLPCSLTRSAPRSFSENGQIYLLVAEVLKRSLFMKSLVIRHVHSERGHVPRFLWALRMTTLIQRLSL